jgi:hypothetical protein
MKVTSIAIVGIILVAVGVLTAVGPWTLFPVCEAGDPPLYVITAANKTLPMPCGYTARAELGVGSLIAIGGIGLMLTKSPSSRRALGFMGLGLGAFAILLPTSLIGVCANASHNCVLETRPALLILGGVAAVASAYVLFKAR